MNLDKLKVGNFIKVCMPGKVERYYICQVKNFVKDMTIPDNTNIQFHAMYPPDERLRNYTLSYESLKKFEAQDVTWTPSEKLMKLIYG